MSDYKKELKEFNDSKSLKIEDAIFSDEKQEIAFKKGIFKRSLLIYKYSDVTGYKPNIVGDTVKKHHGITRAVVGGTLMGGAGAIVGAITGGKQYNVVKNISVDVFFKNNRSERVILVNTETKTSSLFYRVIEKDLNTLINKLDTILAKPKDSDGVDDLHQLKSLLDDGIITQADFDAKKKQILGL